MIQLTIVSFILCGLVVMIKGKVKPNAKAVGDTVAKGAFFGVYGALCSLPVILPVLFWIAVVKFIFF